MNIKLEFDNDVEKADVLSVLASAFNVEEAKVEETFSQHVLLLSRNLFSRGLARKAREAAPDLPQDLKDVKNRLKTIVDRERSERSERSERPKRPAKPA